MPVTDWRTAMAEWPLPWAPPNVPQDKLDDAGLIVVDMQYSCAHPDYGVGLILRERRPATFSWWRDELEERVVPNIQRLLRCFRERGLRIIYLTVGPELPDGADLPRRRREREVTSFAHLPAKRTFGRGTFEHQVRSDLAPQAGELVLNKTGLSGFTSTGLDQALRGLELKTLVFCGVTTNGCVETTCRDAADRGYWTIIAEDACTSLSPYYHQAALLSASLFLTFVTSAADVTQRLSQERPIELVGNRSEVS
jgi:nicotinamidase-related amidase